MDVLRTILAEVNITCFADIYKNERNLKYEDEFHCVESVRIWRYFGPYFLSLVLNTDQSDSEYGHFSRSV